MQKQWTMKRWRVHIKDFGKIEEATVQAAPLTLLIGDNNSGKSYVMTLIYGLCNMDFLANSYQFNQDSQVYQECCKTVDRIVDDCRENGRVVYTMQKSELQLFQKLLKEFLEFNKQVFLEKLFNRPMDIKELYVEFPSDMHVKLLFSVTFKSGDAILSIKKDERAVPWSAMFLDKNLQLNDKQHSFSLFWMLRFMLQWDDDLGSQIYFPTARTGFFLTYKELMGSALQERFSIMRTEKNLLTKPNTDFLIALSQIMVQKENSRFVNITSFLEHQILKGEIQVSDLPVHDVLYHPYGSDEGLPMYVSSGVVTEVTPLLLFLKYSSLGVLFIEEPEISLHPQLQWEMARVLIRIMNRGVPVFVTTHSDIILQHMNNMIKANDLPGKAQFLQNSGYEEDDLLSREQVAVYQFDEQKNGKTYLSKLSCGDYGFEAMTFYDTLKKMNEQIDWIEDAKQ